MFNFMSRKTGSIPKIGTDQAWLHLALDKASKATMAFLQLFELFELIFFTILAIYRTFTTQSKRLRPDIYKYDRWLGMYGMRPQPGWP